MKILLTGGAGFIGSHLTEELLSLGHRVTNIDNFNNYYDPRIKRENIQAFLDHPHYHLLEGDIVDFSFLQQHLSADFEVMIHLAARAGVRPSLEQPLLYEQVNGLGTMNLLECCRLFHIPRFLFASSSSVYGNTKTFPFSETDPVNQPLSPYAATKVAGELYCYNYHHLYHIEVACLRFFTVYGPRQRPDMAIHKFARYLYQEKPLPRYGNGETCRDYTYYTDILQGILACLTVPLTYEIFNLGESQTISLSALIRLLETYLGKKAQITPTPPPLGDMEKTCANIDKARQILNYCPQVPIEVGLERFCQWFLEKGILYLK